MDAQKSDLHGPVNDLRNKYPQNTKPLENQVAGHCFNDKCFTIGMLKDEEGYVLKPVNKPEQGRREILFYETINKSTEKEVEELKLFVPSYYGTITLTIDGRSANFLKLADATRGYKRPCVMDVKMGRQTWEPGVPLKKQLNEEAKYAICKQQCGFCIPGFQVFDILKGTMEKYGKDYGKTLTKENIPVVLKRFLNWESGKSRAVGEEMLQQLNKILNWWRSQRVFHIYSSSVLLTYDAETLRSSETSDEETNSLTETVRVLLIDFAHVVPADNTIDLNYLNGLENFVQILKSVIDDL